MSMATSNSPIKSDTWYHHTKDNNYLIYFVATLDTLEGTVDAMAIVNGVVHKNRVFMKQIIDMTLPKEVIEAPNQEILNLLYLR